MTSEVMDGVCLFSDTARVAMNPKETQNEERFQPEARSVVVVLSFSSGGKRQHQGGGGKGPGG